MILAVLAAASLIPEAEKIIASHTVNPSAVQFENVREAPGIVCGQVNRPNRVGGFDGFTVFGYRSKDDFFVGVTEGIVMNEGKLVQFDITRLVAMNSDERDTINAALERATAMLRACPKKADTN